MRGQFTTPDTGHVEHVDPRKASFIAGVQHPVASGRKARCQHDAGAVGQILHIRPVVIHDPQTLGALILGAALGNKHNPAVEIAALAGDARIDSVRHLMRHPAPAIDSPRKLQTRSQFGTGKHIIQTELHVQRIARHADGTGDQRLRVDRLPVGVLDWRVKIAHGRNIGAGWHFAEQTGANKILGHDTRQIDRHLPCVTAFGLKAGHGKGQGFNDTFGNLDPQRSVLRLRNRGNTADKRETYAQNSYNHLMRILSGLKVISIFCH